MATQHWGMEFSDSSLWKWSPADSDQLGQPVPDVCQSKQLRLWLQYSDGWALQKPTPTTICNWERENLSRGKLSRELPRVDRESQKHFLLECFTVLTKKTFHLQGAAAVWDFVSQAWRLLLLLSICYQSYYHCTVSLSVFRVCIDWSVVVSCFSHLCAPSFLFLFYPLPPPPSGAAVQQWLMWLWNSELFISGETRQANGSSGEKRWDRQQALDLPQHPWDQAIPPRTCVCVRMMCVFVCLALRGRKKQQKEIGR